MTNSPRNSLPQAIEHTLDTMVTSKNAAARRQAAKMLGREDGPFASGRRCGV